ncbi:short chain dehydrogenase/reductase family protein [Penicillium hispanicum]|uniref:short chain dehydrogenase/reductase family protein n=1 Tax=Penicillium hispanicum TaxID=1080232 RepID=UPI00253FCB49|nr:short chain dehydrogenase/reductase family protein [Penicillium hispanicum]KAJ5591681.1 short chain dehydrogenase/reductase family protein [Penicillium hispanicum]
MKITLPIIGCLRRTSIRTSNLDSSCDFCANVRIGDSLAQEFLPGIVAGNHGMAITVASQAGYAVPPNLVDYSTTKAAAIAFHKGLAVELVTRYHAPRVRALLVTQISMRTSQSGHVLVPGTTGHLAQRIRSAPLWL